MQRRNYHEIVRQKSHLRRKLNYRSSSNADEGGLFWILLPQMKFAHKNEAQAPGQKISKERTTFVPFGNATRNHTTLDIFFKNCKLPVDYKGQAKASIF